MRPFSTILLCGSALAAGLVVGANWGNWQFGRAVHADQLDSNGYERLYRELSQTVSPLHEGSNLLGKIAAVTAPTVVHIQSERRIPGRGKEEETGSGVIMTSQKSAGFFVVTNGHVIDKTPLDSISIHMNDGRVVHPERVWSDPQTDVAVLKIPGQSFVAAKWGDSQKLDIGHMVLAMGSPFGLSRSVTFGIISAKGRRQLKLGQSDVLNQDFLQTDAAINPGNSGGPLVDLQGRVVGINTAIASSSGGNEGIGFSIPSHLAQRVMEQLLEHGIVHRAWIGVKLDEKFDSKTASKLRLDRVQGTRINEVFPNSPAARAGLQFDDVVLNFDGVDVQDHDHLINLVSLSPISKKIQVIVWRNGKRQVLTIVLADRTEMPPVGEAPLPPEIGVPIRQMGLTVATLNDDIAADMQIPKNKRGLLVLSINPDSPFSHRLEPYDVICSIGRNRIETPGDLENALADCDMGETVVFHVHRPTDGESTEQLIVWRREE